MDEKQEEVKQEMDLKQETMNTFNEAKEQMKNINFKEEAEVGKGLLLKLWKNPIQTIKDVANDKENKTFKTALLLAAAWAVIVLVIRVLDCLLDGYSLNLLATLKATITPIVRVIAMTLAVYFVNNRAKVSISKVLTSVSIAYVPAIISSVLSILTIISYNIVTILDPITSLLSVVSAIFMYYTVKEFVKKDTEETAFKDFIKVEAVYYVIVLAASFLGLYL